MRVLLVTHSYPPDGIAGVERYTQSLASELMRAGDRVSIVARRPAAAPKIPQTIRERLPDGTLLYRFTGGDIRLDRFLLNYEQLEQLFAMAMIEAAPDVVHINHLLGLSPRFIEIAHRLGAAVVFSLHDFYVACPRAHLQKPSGELCEGPDGGRECARTCFLHEGTTASFRWGLRTLYFRRLLATAERIICPSRYVAAYFEQFGADPTRVRIIPNGILLKAADLATEAHVTPQKRGTLNLAFLGSVVAHKGVHLILEALRLADLGSVDLVVLGQIADREYARSLRERATTILGLRLRMYGGYDPSELPYLLHEVDCVISPSQVPESFSITTREALTQGIPVVVARLGALPDAVIEGENGFTFDPDRPGELADILERLVEDEMLLPRLREGARRSPVLTVSEHMRAVRAIYEEAMNTFLFNCTLHRGETEELRFLHSASLQLDFAASH